MLRPLLGGLAHHFNNVLSGILGWVSLASTLPPDTLAALSLRVKEQVEYASRLTRLVLSITRRAEEEGAARVCDLTHWSADAVALVKTATPPHVSLVADLPGAELWASVSPVVYARLLLDLLLTAVQGSEGSTPHAVRLEVTAIDGACRVSLESLALGLPAVEARGLRELLCAGTTAAAPLVWASASALVLELGGELSRDVTERRVPRWVIRLPAARGTG